MATSLKAVKMALLVYGLVDEPTSSYNVLCKCSHNGLRDRINSEHPISPVTHGGGQHTRYSCTSYLNIPKFVNVAN